MHRQPAALDGQLHARAVLRRAAFILEQERAIDLLDMNAAVLHRLDGAGDLRNAARRLCRAAIWNDLRRIELTLRFPIFGE